MDLGPRTEDGTSLVAFSGRFSPKNLHPGNGHWGGCLHEGP